MLVKRGKSILCIIAKLNETFVPKSEVTSAPTFILKCLKYGTVNISKNQTST